MTHTIAIPVEVKKWALYAGHSLEDPEIQYIERINLEQKIILQKQNHVVVKVPLHSTCFGLRGLVSLAQKNGMGS